MENGVAIPTKRAVKVLRIGDSKATPHSLALGAYLVEQEVALSIASIKPTHRNEAEAIILCIESKKEAADALEFLHTNQRKNPLMLIGTEVAVPSWDAEVCRLPRISNQDPKLIANRLNDLIFAQELGESRPQASLVLNQALILVNPNGFIVAHNTKAQEMLGAAQLVGCSLSTLILEQSQRSPSSISFRNIPIKQNNKNTLIQADNYGTLINTQERSHAQRLIDTGRLSASISHEVNNAITYILSNQQVMEASLSVLAAYIKQGKQNPKTAQAIRAFGVEGHLQEMNEILEENKFGAKQISSAVFQLGVFSRKGLPQASRVDICEVIEMACRLTTNEIKQRSELILDLKPCPKISGFQTELSQVFVNLLLNAAHAIEQKGGTNHRVEVRCETRQDSIVATLSDTGCGIDSKTLEKIFDPFFTTKGVGEGSGLGLSICSQIIKNHGGHLGVESNLGDGTRFIVTIPFETGLAMKPEHKKNIEQLFESTDDPLRLLLIDDEIKLLRSAKRILKRYAEVDCAEGAEEALSYLKNSQNYDLIACDIMMPDVDGPALYSTVAKRWPKMAQKMVFVTGGAFSPNTKSFIQEEKRPCFPKPTNWDELLHLGRLWRDEG